MKNMMMESKKYEMIFYIADKKINRFMEMFDLKPKHKVFISQEQVADLTTTTKVNKNYITKLIFDSKKNDDFWIPMIGYEGKLYVCNEIMEISDGKKTCFINNHIYNIELCDPIKDI